MLCSLWARWDEKWLQGSGCPHDETTKALGDLGEGMLWEVSRAKVASLCHLEPATSLAVAIAWLIWGSENPTPSPH